MQVEFIGVGEAFDPALGNSCTLLHGDSRLLVDCGYGAPAKYFTAERSGDFLDAIYLTHAHADHCFGIPSLLLRMWQEQRSKPLTIIGQPGTKSHILSLTEMGYPGILEKLIYELHFIETIEPVEFNEFSLSFAETVHPLKNYAIRVMHNETIIGLSGDGALTDDSRALFQDCQAIIHEAYMLEEQCQGHTSAKEVIEFAQTLSSIKTLALVHIERHERDSRKQDFLTYAGDANFQVVVPEPGDMLEL